MHSTILGIWTTDILDACHIIKDIKNNRIRWSFDTSLCKQENCVELLREKKLYFNPPQTYWLTVSELPETLGWFHFLNVSVFDFGTFLFCRTDNPSYTQGKEAQKKWSASPEDAQQVAPIYTTKLQVSALFTGSSFLLLQQIFSCAGQLLISSFLG